MKDKLPAEEFGHALHVAGVAADAFMRMAPDQMICAIAGTIFIKAYCKVNDVELQVFVDLMKMPPGEFMETRLDPPPTKEGGN